MMDRVYLFLQTKNGSLERCSQGCMVQAANSSNELANDQSEQQVLLRPGAHFIFSSEFYSRIYVRFQGFYKQDRSSALPVKMEIHSSIIDLSDNSLIIRDMGLRMIPSETGDAEFFCYGL